MFVGAVLSIGFCFFAYAFVYIGNAACADFVSMRVRSELAQAQESGQMLAPVEWRDAKTRLEDGLAYSPDNAEYVEDIAYLHAVRGVSALHSKEISQPMLGEALQKYRSAARLRPMSCRTWANIALIKSYLDQDDAELWGAFDKAQAYGDDDPNTQAMLLVIAMQRWSTLDGHRLAALRASYARALPSVKKRLLNIAVQGRHAEFVLM
jgi:hypothetical protein